MNGIGFIGAMRSGKDTAAEYIQAKYGGTIKKFADPLYEIEAAIFRIAGVSIPEDKTKRRKLLQFIGTDWGREVIDPDIWMKIMESRLVGTKFSTTTPFVMITDTRFPNEVELLRKHNFYIVKISRPLDQRITAGASNTTHKSENMLHDYTDFDIEIANNINDLAVYHNTVDDVYHALKNETFKKGVKYVTGASGDYL